MNTEDWVFTVILATTAVLWFGGNALIGRRRNRQR
jgi:hypothetical protein